MGDLGDRGALRFRLQEDDEKTHRRGQQIALKSRRCDDLIDAGLGLGNLRQLLLINLHLGGRGSLRGEINAPDHSAIADGEESRGDHDKQPDRAAQTEQPDQESEALALDHPLQRALVALFERVEVFVEPALVAILALRLPQQASAHHRRHDDGHDAGENDGQDNGHCHFMKHASDESGHENDRDEDRAQRKGHREHREADFLGSQQRRHSGRLSIFQVPHGILQDDHSIINQQSNRQG